MRPPTKLQVSANFWPPNNVTTIFSPTVLSRFISARLFSVPQVEKAVKRAQLCGCWWDPRSRKWWIKECPKRGIFGSSSETVRPCKSLYIYQWSLFWIIKYVLSSCVLDLKKKSVLKPLDRIVSAVLNTELVLPVMTASYGAAWSLDLFSPKVENWNTSILTET